MPISTRGAGAAAPMVMDRESGGAAMELEAEPELCEQVGRGDASSSDARAMKKLLEDSAEMPRLQVELEESRDELETTWELVVARDKQVDLLEQLLASRECLVRMQAEKLGIPDPLVV